MIIPYATIIALTIALPSAIVEPPRHHVPAVEKKVDAKEEARKTLALRAAWKGRRRALAAERDAVADAKEAPVPPPFNPIGGGGLSTSTSLTVPVVVHVGMPMGGMGAGPSPMVGIPAMAGQLPPGWTQVYGPLLRRFQDSGL